MWNRDYLNAHERLAQFMVKRKRRLKRYLAKFHRDKKLEKALFLNSMERSQAMDLNNSKQKGGSMLVLTRRPGESFWIGKEIQVKILESFETSIRIGIKAPIDIPIKREELCNRESHNEHN